MEYVNTKTGVKISTECEIKGGDWVKVTAPKPKKAGGKNDKGLRNN